MSDTRIDPEEYAYPEGTLRASRRRGRVRWPDGRVRSVTLGIPDTYFTIPAYGRERGRYVAGYVSVADWRDEEANDPPNVREGDYLFHPRQAS